MDEDTETEGKVGPVEEGGDDEEERDEGGGVEEEKEKGEDRVAVLQHCTSVFLGGQWIKILMMKVNQGPTLKETESKTTMMMMVMDAVNAQLMYQHNCRVQNRDNDVTQDFTQCIHEGSPIIFISSFTPVSFSYTIRWKYGFTFVLSLVTLRMGGTMKEKERTRKRGMMKPSNSVRLLLGK